MKNCILILISILFVNCSSTDKKKEVNEYDLRIELINDLFVEIVNTNFNKVSYDKYRKRRDSSDYVVIFIDKFSRVDKNYVQTEKYFPDSLNSNDYNVIFKKMIDSTLNDTSTIDLNRITETGEFKIRKYEKGLNFLRDTTMNFVTALMFSTPHFNDKFDKAMFGLSYFCGGTCGYESIIVCKKDKDKWLITNNDINIEY